MATPKLSQRALNTPPSPIRKLSPLARAAKEAGRKVYHLNIGQPDIRSPREFFDGLHKYRHDVLAYEDSQGNYNLTKAWCAYMNKSLGLATRPDDFLITSGASEALIFIFMVCCDPGDEVIIFDPTYANYMGFAAIAGVTLVPIACNIEDGFTLPDRAAIESRITERTKAVLLCSPNNPTGSVYSREQLQDVLNLCNERELFFVIDETYREFVYDGLAPLSVLHLEPDNPRIIVVDSLSKRFSLCGARLGCLITCNQKVLETSLNLAQARLATGTLEQFAAAYMLERIPDDFIKDVVTTYRARRDMVFRCLGAISGVTVHKPQGAFYCVARLPVDDAEDFAKYMLRDFSFDGATTFVAPAAGFYMQNGRGASKIRVAYVIEEHLIEQAVSLLARGLELYQKSLF